MHYKYFKLIELPQQFSDVSLSLFLIKKYPFLYRTQSYQIVARLKIGMAKTAVSIIIEVSQSLVSRVVKLKVYLSIVGLVCIYKRLIQASR